MLARFTGFAVALLFVAGAMSAAAAEKMTDGQEQQAIDFAAHNSEFVLYHEGSHLLVDQLRFPGLGKEEDAADNMATYTLLRQHTRESDQVLADAARGWLIS